MPNTFIRDNQKVTAPVGSPISGKVFIVSGGEFHGSVAAGTNFTRIAEAPSSNSAYTYYDTAPDAAPDAAGHVLVGGGVIGLVTMAHIGSTITFADARDNVHIVAPADEVPPIGDVASAHAH